MIINKQRIKLTETKLKKIIHETIKQVLTESSVWYGSIEPFENIINCCHQIKERFKEVENPDYEDMSDDNSGIEIAIYQWADKIEKEAQNYIDLNSDKYSIGNGY